jgi:hypothetical protein
MAISAASLRRFVVSHHSQLATPKSIASLQLYENTARLPFESGKASCCNGKNKNVRTNIQQSNVVNSLDFDDYILGDEYI